VSNVDGSLEPPRRGYFHRSAGATFGKPRGSVPVDTKNYTKKGTGQPAGSYLPASNKNYWEKVNKF